jgi:hypothetical protein
MRTRSVLSLLFAVLMSTSGVASAQTPPPPPAPLTGGAGASPVERPIGGDLGMSFVFGGLAPMSVAGMVSHTVNRLFFAEVGMRWMLSDRWTLPFSFGLGMFSHNPDGGNSQNDLGVSFSVGFQRYFRVWRRIAPYFGAKFHMHYVDPSGDRNYLVQIALGPTLGIEYFIGDRVSLQMEYVLLLGVNITDPVTQIGLQTSLSYGGQMGLNFYF